MVNVWCEHKYRRDVENCPFCELNEADQQLAAARAALADREGLLLLTWKAIFAACCTEEGLDASEGVPLLDQIEALYPEAKALREEIARKPAT